METSINQRSEMPNRLAKRCVLVFSFVALHVACALADNGPSLSNLHKNGAAISEEQKRIAQQEFMSYVWMVLGFSVVIAIAWISTVKARNRSKVEAEAKAKFVQQHLNHKKAHGGLHKARR